MAMPMNIRQTISKDEVRVTELSNQTVKQFQVAVEVTLYKGDLFMKPGWYAYIDTPIELPKWVASRLANKAKVAPFSKRLEIVEYNADFKVSDYATLYDLQDHTQVNDETWYKPGKP